MSSETTRVKYACPQCDSENIQRFSVVFQNGTSQSISSTSGIGIGGNAEGGLGLGGFGAVTESSSSTLMASQMTPPAMKPNSSPVLSRLFLVIILVICGLSQIGTKFSVTIVAFLMAGVVFWFYRRACKSSEAINKWNEEEYPKLLYEWEHSWVCHKCGHTFQLL